LSFFHDHEARISQKKIGELNSMVTGTPGAELTPGVPAMSRTQQTLLFPTLVRRFKQDRRLSVLEIGPALPETVAFFSQFRCRLHFAAMYTDPVLQLQTGEHTEDELAEHISQSFGFRKETRFDLCLFWDFLNYLDDKALRAFNTALRPYLHQSTRAHAFTVRTLNTRFPNQQYGIEQAHMFSIRPRSGKQAHTSPHTQAILVNLLSSFDIDQGMLLPDGRLEILMTACLQEQAAGTNTGPK
jgi:hypothetical protein